MLLIPNNSTLQQHFIGRNNHHNQKKVLQPIQYNDNNFLKLREQLITKESKYKKAYIIVAWSCALFIGVKINVLYCFKSG